MPLAVHSLGFLRLTLWNLIDFVLPPRCVMTGAVVDKQGMVAPEIWRELNFIAVPFCSCCGVPFEFASETGVAEGVLCASCIASPPPFDSARAALKYDDSSRKIILQFKHADKTHAVPAFLPWLRRAGAEMIASADIAVPVPLHRWRLLRRRYNQSALIGGALAAECGLEFLPDALVRTRATPSQGHMGYKERKKNVRNAFTVNPKRAMALYGKTVILIDDVYTTGATVKECARVLKKAGAKAVHVLSVARVVRAEYRD